MSPLTKRVLLAAAVFAGFMALAAVVNKPRFNCDISEYHTVMRGDTLWSIAEDYCTGNVEAVVDNLVETYGHPANLRVGTRVFLPQHEDCTLTLVAGEVSEDCQ